MARPCPFCCGTKLLLKTDMLGYARITCETCGTTGPYGKPNDNALRYWNKRDPNQHLFELEQKPTILDDMKDVSK